MLRSLKDLEHYKVVATDGEIGKVVRFLFDDERWVVRYLVVQAGGPLFLKGRRVLISPISFGNADPETQRFHLTLTMDKIKNSPSIDVDKPVSRQNEESYSHYYGYPNYWGASGLWGTGIYPNTLWAGTVRTGGPDAIPPAMRRESVEPSGDVHLRSDEDVRGYGIQGSDGAIGHVEDFIVDEETWEIRYLVVNTSNWLMGKHVLVAPQWTNEISWTDGTVYLDLSRQAIKDGPEWDAVAAVNRAYETRLYDHYGRPAYWLGGMRRATPPPSEQSHPKPQE